MRNEEKSVSQRELNDALMESVLEHSRDHFLVVLVTVINALRASMGVTLVLDGVVVTGQLIDGRTYFEELGKQMRDAAGKTGEMIVEHVLRPVSEIYSEDDAERIKRGDVVKFFHLANARVLAPGEPAVPDNGMLLRGRIARVSGFTIGELQIR